MFSTFQNNIIHLKEHTFGVPGGKDGMTAMTATDELVKYILNLTPEQVEKIVSQLPRLSSLLEEPSLPCLQEQSLQTRSA